MKRKQNQQQLSLFTKENRNQRGEKKCKCTKPVKSVDTGEKDIWLRARESDKKIVIILPHIYEKDNLKAEEEEEELILSISLALFLAVSVSNTCLSFIYTPT